MMRNRKVKINVVEKQVRTYHLGRSEKDFKRDVDSKSKKDKKKKSSSAKKQDKKDKGSKKKSKKRDKK